MVYDVIVVGLGPAGIMATLICQRSGLNVIAIDKGRHYVERDRNNPLDVANGFGGAGLFSDGKLSFFPAASLLWEKSDSEKIKRAYILLFNEFKSLGYAIPTWQNRWTNSISTAKCKKRVKRYQSHYFTRKARDQFIKCAFHEIGKNVILDSEVVRIKHQLGKYLVETVNGNFKAHKILLCTGKCGNGIIEKLDLKIPNVYKYEFGFRVETTKENFKPNALKLIDYKYIEKIDGDTEFRTFCCCKSGIVLKSKYIDHVSYNGSTSNKPTQLSNIGLTIRCNTKENPCVQEAISCLARKDEVEMSYKDGHNWTRDFVYGAYTDKLLAERMAIVLKNFRQRDKIKIYAPEIEYFGNYPIFNWNSFRISLGHDIWIAGDLSGKYRGIVAAMVSGIYAALDMVETYE